MCIIIYKPKGITVSLETLDNCWQENPDGAGFMFTHNGQVTGSKGYMKYNELIDRLKQNGMITKGHINYRYDVVIHFRIATHGGVSPAKCHPFPASSNTVMLDALEWQDTHGIAHNGIMAQYAREGLSDTQGFIRDVLCDPFLLGNLTKPSIKRILEDITSGSKFIFMSQERIVMLGNWIKDNGVYYSNDGYKVFKVTGKDYRDWLNTSSRKKDYRDWLNISPCNFQDEWGKEHIFAGLGNPERLVRWCSMEDGCENCQYSYIAHSGTLSCEVWEGFVNMESALY